MSQLVKTKRQANFKDFKRFGAFKGLVEQKNVVFNSFLCKMSFFGARGPLKRSFHSTWPTHAKKKPNLHANSLTNSSLFDEFVCKLGLFWFHSRFKMAHACQKGPNLHTNELNTTFFCSTSPLKAPNRLKPLKLA
jgi:hypothetical protein